jgi:hypothetical protein
MDEGKTTMEWTIITKADRIAASAEAVELDSPAVFGKAGESRPSAPPDDYVARIVKWLPAELVAFWLTVDTWVRGSTSGADSLNLRRLLLSFALIIGTALTPIWMRRVRKVKKLDQLVISAFAFPLWVFATGGPFATWEWYETTGQIVAGFMLIIFGMGATLYDPQIWIGSDQEAKSGIAK